MASLTNQDIIQQILPLRYSPHGVARVVFDNLEAMTKGQIRLVDPTNPVAFTIESGVMMATAGMVEMEAAMRRLYPSLSQTTDDLYPHMSDVDYIGRFSTPARCSSFILFFKLSDIKREAVAVGDTGISRIVIPRHTEITIAGAKFTFQYPINIDVMPYGGLVIYYDVEKPSPIQVLSTNSVDWRVTRVGEDEFLILSLPLMQFAIKSVYATLDNTTGFTKSYAFDNEFYYCRAFMKDPSTAKWIEIKTTHTEQVYDPTTPTVALQANANALAVTVPQIYFNRDLISDSLRLDIYTSQGPMDVQLDRYSPDAFAVKWLDHDEDDVSIYVAPLSLISGTCYSIGTVSGGAHALTFAQLRDRVMSNATGANNNPITAAQLEAALNSLDYELVLDKDTITSRVWKASRLLPAPSLQGSVTAANCAIRMFQSNLDDLIDLPTTYWNGAGRLVIKPETVFRNVNGIVSIVPQSEVNALLGLSVESRVAELNATKYLYTPFHYVMDVTGYTFALRPYSLERPEIPSKFFIQNNSTLGLDVSIDRYEIAVSPDNDGYYITIQTKSGESFKALDLDGGQIQVQASFLPAGATDRAVIVGVDLGATEDGERIYKFFIQSNHDINANHEMILESFHQYDATPQSIPTPLSFDLDFVFIVKNYQPLGTMTTDMDQLILPYELTGVPVYFGVVHERLSIKLGDYLSGLWQRARSVIGEEQYARYPNDVYLYADKNVFERNPDGSIKVTYDALLPPPGIVNTVIFYTGDPVLENYTINRTAAVTLAAQATVLFASGSFTSADVGKKFIFRKAGAGGENLFGTISAVASPTQITLSTNVLTATLINGVFIYGDHVILHHHNDVVLDSEGNPTLIGGTSNRGMLRQADIFFIDGAYKFATDGATIDYRDSIPDYIRDWVVTDIGTISQSLLENTYLYLYPQVTVGKIPVVINDGVKSLIDAEQSFTVKYYLTDENFKNAKLKTALESTAVSVIADILTKTTIATTDMESTLKTMVGDSIVAVDISGLGGVAGITTATVTNRSVRPSIGKKAVQLADQTISVEDDVTIVFINHTKKP